MSFQVPDGFVAEEGEARFVTHIGPLYEKWDGKSLTSSFLAEQIHANKRGVVHGGMLVTLADHNLSRMVWAAVDLQMCTTISLNSDFVAGAQVGDWIEARGEITRLTRSLVFTRAKVTSGDGLLMTASGVWKRLGKK